MNSQDTSSGKKPESSRRARPVAIAAVLLALAGGGYAFWSHKAPPAQGGYCPADAATATSLKPLARGEVAAFSVSERPQVFPAISFTAPDGKPVTLDAFKGKTVLVNLWATWCVPCRKEMPALDKLQAEFGGKDFEVVAINVDTTGPDKPRQWLAENGVRNLAFYTDSTGGVLKTLRQSGHFVGLPTTVLINAEGCQSGILKGGAEWASDDALALIKAALARKG